MGRETYKADAELSEDDRFRINSARATLRRYGRNPQPDMPEPLSELGYEQRMARARAMELAVAAAGTATVGYNSVPFVSMAREFYEWIWEGKDRAEV